MTLVSGVFGHLQSTETSVPCYDAAGVLENSKACFAELYVTGRLRDVVHGADLAGAEAESELLVSRCRSEPSPRWST